MSVIIKMCKCTAIRHRFDGNYFKPSGVQISQINSMLKDNKGEVQRIVCPECFAKGGCEAG